MADRAAEGASSTSPTYTLICSTLHTTRRPSQTTRSISMPLIDKNFLFRDGSIGGLFLPVKGYYASVLHQKAGDGDAIW